MFAACIEDAGITLCLRDTDSLYLLCCNSISVRRGTSGPGSYWCTANPFSHKNIYHPRVELHLHAKFQLPAFCSFQTITWRKIVLSPNHKISLFWQNIYHGNRWGTSHALHCNMLTKWDNICTGDRANAPCWSRQHILVHHNHNILYTVSHRHLDSYIEGTLILHEVTHHHLCLLGRRLPCSQTVQTRPQTASWSRWTVSALCDNMHTCV